MEALANGRVDDELFFQFVTDILARANKNGRKVRAFGEMVAVMRSKGFYGAAVRLEHLWHRLCAENSFTLFCAYPKIGFAENGSEAIAHICAAHSKFLLPEDCSGRANSGVPGKASWRWNRGLRTCFNDRLAKTEIDDRQCSSHSPVHSAQIVGPPVPVAAW